MAEENKEESQLFDKDSNPVEGAMTKDQVEKEIEKRLEAVKGETDAKIEEVKKEITEKFEGEIKTKDDKIKGIKEELDKIGDKGENVGKLRKLLETTEQERDDFKQALADGLSDIKKGLSQEKVDEEIEKRTGGDEEKTKLVKFHYDSFQGEPKDAKERKERLDNACILAKVPVPGAEIQSPGGGTVAFGGRAPTLPPVPAGTGKMSEEVKDLGKKKMGVTQEDIDRVEEPKK